VEFRSAEPLRFYTEPAYLVLRSVEEVDTALGVSTWSASPEVNLSREVVLLVHRGECRTGGYAVAITGVTLEAGTPGGKPAGGTGRPAGGGKPAPGGLLRVKVAFTDPAPSSFVTMVITYPQAAAAVERPGLEGVSTVVFVDSKGQVLKTVEVNL
jgi:hypothetical protein